MKQFIVDLPNPNDVEGTWIEVATFETKDAALKWLRDTFDADEQGRVCLLSEFSFSNAQATLNEGNTQ